MTNALAIAPTSTTLTHSSNALAFEPRDIADAFKLANILVASRMLPDSIKTPEAAFTIIMTGRELGLTAMQSIRSIHVMKGRAVLAADLMVALTKGAPECEYFRLIESTDAIATYETKRRNEPAATKMNFTIEQAKMAGLLGNDNWRKFPAAMLRARCSSALCRAVFPDLMMGIYDADELAPGRGVPDGAPIQPVETYQSVQVEAPSAEPLAVAHDTAVTEAGRTTNAAHVDVDAVALTSAYGLATTSEAVRAVSGRVVEAKKAGRLTVDHLEALRRAKADADRRLASEAQASEPLVMESVA